MSARYLRWERYGDWTLCDTCQRDTVRGNKAWCGVCNLALCVECWYVDGHRHKGAA